MHAPDALVGLRGEADQGQAQQGAQGGVEAPGPVGGEVLFKARLLLRCWQLPPVEALPGEGYRAVDDLQGGRQPLPDEVRAQDRVAVEEALPGPAERLLVQLAPQRPGQLQEVGLGAGLEPGVEEQALLHRGQGVDVLHLPVGPEQGVDRLLVEPGQGEVGRGEAPGPGREAVLDEGGQAAQEGLRQGLHRLPVVQGRAVEPLQAQPALDHAAVDLQDVAAGPGGGGGGTGGLAGQAEGRVLGGRLIELAQVVEADLGRRHGLQRGSRRER